MKDVIEKIEKSIPKESEKKLKIMKESIEKFKDKLLEKFKDYVLGIELLPPSKDDKEKKINLLILIDDSNTKKMSKQELKEKLTKIVKAISEEVNKELNPEVLLLSELWQSCFDAKYEILKIIATGAIVYDKGMLNALKIAEVHKTMVINKFERYIVSYVLSGSLTQGRATKDSDIDVFIVVDDTDVKRMTRGELKEKLRAIIIGMGIEAGELTGIQNKLNIQVYILTEFWESLRDANPVIFTLLRHGVPLYDRGLFMPWKQLLSMGKIKPTPEAIDLFMSSGERLLKKVEDKIKELGMEDIYYALLTPSQAALMEYGMAPPVPRDTPVLMKKIFVEKEKMLEEEYVEILKKVINIRKDIEHGKRLKLTGKEIDELLEQGNKYLKRIEKLFKEIEEIKNMELAREMRSNLVTILREVLRYEGIEKISEEEILDKFKDVLINTGKIPDKYMKLLNSVYNFDVEKGRLTKLELDKYRQKVKEIVDYLTEYLEKNQFREVERAKIKISYKNKLGEILITKSGVYVIKDIKKKEVYFSDNIKEWDLKKIDMEEYEKRIRDRNLKVVREIDKIILNNIYKIFGEDVKIIF